MKKVSNVGTLLNHETIFILLFLSRFPSMKHILVSIISVIRGSFHPLMRISPYQEHILVLRVGSLIPHFLENLFEPYVRILCTKMYLNPRILDSNIFVSSVIRTVKPAITVVLNLIQRVLILILVVV